MLIKVEAINIYSFVNEAQNLNSVRGAGLMLLELPEKLTEWLRTSKKWKTEVITSGASTAVMDVATDLPAGQVKEAVRAWLVGEGRAHCTIGVGVLERSSGDFLKDNEDLTLQIRTEQMHSFSIAGSEIAQGPNVCSWDRVRPASRNIAAHESPLVSAATAVRYEYGRERKVEFFKRHAGIQEEPRLTWDLEDLAASQSAGGLKDKIAIFYADGNKFRKGLQEMFEKLKDKGQRRAMISSFDQQVQGDRRNFLKALLAKAAQPHWQTAGGEIRMEILLWGGDELMIVVPAWCGWETVETFAETVLGKMFHHSKQSMELRYAMGLIFAHRKAPIHALTSLVKELAEEGKTKDRKQDLLSYLVLESFDHVGEDLERFRTQRCKSKMVQNNVTIPIKASSATKVRRAMDALKQQEFPRRKVFRAANWLARGYAWEDVKKAVEPGLKKEQLDGMKAWCALFEATGAPEPGWFHLAELWDYVGSEVGR